MIARSVQFAATYLVEREHFWADLPTPCVALAGRTPYDELPAWQDLMEKPFPERIKALADPSVRSLLAAEAERAVSRSAPLAPKNHVNVIDLTALRLLTPGLTRDFPFGDLPGRVVSRSGTRPGPAGRPGSPVG